MPTSSNASAEAAALAPTVEIAIPVYNERAALEAGVRRLCGYLDSKFPFPVSVTIADNASTDGTWDIASRLAAQIPLVRAIHLEEKGRGRALRAVWAASSADVVAYMDVDLATDLNAILPLVAPLLSGHSDVAIGTRLARGARVVRGPKRELISRAYNLLLRTTLRNQFTDAQCGFKAVRADVARAILPHVADQGWFFDTEFLVLAEHNGLRIHEVPVDWTDDPDSRVDVVATALGDLRGMWRVQRRLARGDGRIDLAARRAAEPLGTAGRFVGVGGASTLAYLTLFLVLQTVLSLAAANAVALSASAALNYAAHRRYTFLRRDGWGFAWASVAAWAAGLALSTVALGLVARISAGVLAALVVLVAANAAISTGRVVAIRASLLRGHIDGRAASTTTAGRTEGTSGFPAEGPWTAPTAGSRSGNVQSRLASPVRTDQPALLSPPSALTAPSFPAPSEHLESK